MELVALVDPHPWAVEVAWSEPDWDPFEGCDEDGCPDFCGGELPAEVLRELDAGGDLALFVEEFAAGPHELDDALLVEAVAAAKRVEAWAAARGAALAAVLSRREVMTTRVSEGGDTQMAIQAAGTELAMRLGMSRWQARELVKAGRALFEDGPLSETGAAVASGAVSWSKACVLVKGLAEVAAPVAWAVQEKVLPGAARRTVRQLEKDVAEALITVDPVDADVRHARARGTRKVTRPKALADGMAQITAVLPADDAACVDLALHAAARAARRGGDKRTSDQVRADALTTMAITALNTGWIGQPPSKDAAASSTANTGSDAGTGTDVSRAADAAAGADGSAEGNAAGVGQRSGPRTQARFIAVPVAGLDDGAGPTVADLPGTGPRPALRLATGRVQLNITVPLTVLMPGPEDVPAPLTPGDVPTLGGPALRAATLHGIGPIPGSIARALAAGGRWRRIVTDPVTGTVLDVGRQTYAPPEGMARHVRARDHHCVRPGCAVPADHCELDHTHPYASGGTTAAHNLGALCLADHRLKSAGTFKVTQPQPGVFEWDTPARLRYRRNIDGTHTLLPAAPDLPPIDEIFPFVPDTDDKTTNTDTGPGTTNQATPDDSAAARTTGDTREAGDTEPAS